MFQARCLLPHHAHPAKIDKAGCAPPVASEGQRLPLSVCVLFTIASPRLRLVNTGPSPVVRRLRVVHLQSHEPAVFCLVRVLLACNIHF